jgi:hypothetical protein
LTSLVCAVAFFAAGCHSNNNASGYGIAWVSLTDDPGDFTTYTVNIDSITLTRSDGAVVSALATAETVDFTKLRDVAELWGTATIPIGTYTSASIVLDYTSTLSTNPSAFIAAMVNGKPQQLTVDTTAGVAATTQTINVILDPANPLVIAPTYGTTAAVRLAIDVDLAASGYFNSATDPTTLYIRPYVTVAIAPSDSRLIRVRGPLINTSVDLGTYTVYVRPFHDEQNSLGALSLFSNADTIFTINGAAYTGTDGVTQLSKSSAGTTVTAAYTTYEPTPTPTATAGIFHPVYVVAGGTLEDVYTQGLEGDVIARSGNTLTLQGSTLFVNDGITTYCPANTQVILGASTLVTADNNTTLTNLNYNSIAVGQHIIARGIYDNNDTPACDLPLDATGSSAEDTGSVRLIATDIAGSILASSAGGVSLNLQTINDWPVSDYDFAGNGTSVAATPTAANFSVDTAALVVPDSTVGDPLFVSGIFTPFGTAPPDFHAFAISAQASVPATLHVIWDAGTTAPFSSLTATGASIDLANPKLSSAVIRIGSQSINLQTLGASPQIIPAVAPAPVKAIASGTGSVEQTLPPVVLPEFSYGDPLAVAPAGIYVYSAFGTFGTNLTTALKTASALHLVAKGTYNQATNTFNANSVDVVL